MAIVGVYAGYVDKELWAERGNRFAALVGLELKGQIFAHERSIVDVANEIGHAGPTLTNWLNDKAHMPVPVYMKVCEALGIDPGMVISRAYARLLEEDRAARFSVEPGYSTGHVYDPDLDQAAQMRE